jgi:uncharacterized protein YukE
MTSPGLGQAAAALGQALQSLERSLEATRSSWDDSARRVFDHRHADALVLEGRRMVDELTQLAQDLASAARTLSELEGA